MKNKYFAQFYKLDLSGNISEALGSDSVYNLDGRLSRENMVLEAIQWNERLKHLNKRYTGFSVHYGTYTNNRVVLSYTSF
jgi:hypothetical protein